MNGMNRIGVGMSETLEQFIPSPQYKKRLRVEQVLFGIEREDFEGVYPPASDSIKRK
jgi:hypothetical protein